MEETAVVAGAAGGAGQEAMDGRRPVTYAAELLLLVLPSAHLLYLPVGGAMATGADLALLLLLLAWSVDLLAGGGAGGAVWRVLGGKDAPGLPRRRFFLGVAVLLVFGGYVVLSGVWGYHASYALAKGLGLAALAAAAAALASSGIRWERAVDAWVGGTAVALVLTALLAAGGPEILQARILYDQGGILGLPFQRISGPLLHPNMLGDYLVVSGVLLWARWPSLSPRGGLWATLLGVAMALALFLSAATAWVSAGIAAAALARWSGRYTPEAREEGKATWVPVVRAVGAAGAAATLVALLVPLDLRLGPLAVSTSGIRPDIWASAAGAVLEAPLLGVGAAPYLAEAVDPMLGGAPVLWDAHNAYLSVLGQFGLVGTILLGAGLWWALRGALAGVSDARVRFALIIALVAVAVNAVFMASEDLRHVWLLVGMCGVAGAVEE